MARQSFLSLAAALAVGLVHAEVPVPAVWFKADMGVTADPSGNVTKWANQGSLGADLDLTPAAKTGASTTALTVAEDATFGTVVHFDGTDFLTAAVESAYGLTTAGGVTLVALINAPAADHYTRPYPSIFSHRCSDGRTPFNLYYNTNLQSKKGEFLACPFGGELEFGKGALGRGLVSVTADAVSHGYLNGGYANDIKAKGSGMGAVEEGVFRLGYVDGGKGTYNGDFAEFRLYDRALTAAERFQVECELAAKYNLDINPVQVSTATDADLIPKTVFAGCATEPCAFGDAPKGGLAVATIETTGTSGQLTVSLGSAPTAEENSLVYLANNGATGLDTVWCVAAAPGARAKPLNLSFDSAVSPDEKHLVLYGNSNGRWARIPVEVTQSADKFVCTLPAGWTSEKLSLRVRRGLFIVVQ